LNFTTRAAIALLALACARAARADEAALQLKEGPEAVVVRAYCSMCHSIDYLQMNSTFMKRAGWEAEVRKMVKVMGAPVPEEDVARIVDYLTRRYGTD
jgi:cytochrome c5